MYHDGYSTVPDHMPEKHRAYAESKEYNAAYFQKKASQVGPHTRMAIDAILSKPYFVQQSYRACQGILRLGTRYTPQRLEEACRHVEPKSAASYKLIESILKHSKDMDVQSQCDDCSYIPYNGNVRGPEAYR